MRVGVFKYCISACGLKSNGKGECLNPEIIEEELNSFMENKEIVSINQSTYVVDRHNNGGCDEVWITYTILYK